MVILPVWSAGENQKEINFETLFKKYNPIFANKIETDKNCVKINNKVLNKGLIIGFGAGDITYQLRNFV